MLLEQLIVFYGLWNVLCGQYGMKLTIVAEHRAFLHNFLNYRHVVCISGVERFRFIFHFQHIGVTHPLVIDVHLLIVLCDVIHRLCIRVCLSQCHLFADVLLLECVFSIKVETKNVLVRNTTGKRVFVEHVAKYNLCSHLATSILWEYRCACKSEKNGAREGILYCQEHATTAVLARTCNTSMALIHNKHDALLVNLVNS